jgi:hypothetical protein
MKTLSIIIVNYNSAFFVRQEIELLFPALKLKKDIEVLVIDNNSRENDKSSLIHYIKRIEKSISIKLLLNDSNIGFSAANNKAVRLATGKFILFLNPDTKVNFSQIEPLFGIITKDKLYAAVTIQLTLANGKIDESCHRGFPTPWRAFCHFSGISILFPHSKLFNGYHLGFTGMDKTHEIESCSGAFLFVKREVGEQLGWFDTDYFWYGDDIDFCYRMHQAGYRILFVPYYSGIHFRGVTSGIKKHSSDISTASKETKLITQKARFDAMRLFYSKHYFKKYPKILSFFILRAISFFEYIKVRSV